jgi:hypothetical protein
MRPSEVLASKRNDILALAAALGASRVRRLRGCGAAHRQQRAPRGHTSHSITL